MVNNLFAQSMGYQPAEMIGMKHRQFCTPEFVHSPEYGQFWEKLRSGVPVQEKIQRVSKQGELLWFEATYTPVLNEEGNVQGVIKIATDITQRENDASRLAGQLQQMADRLLDQAEAGSARSAEIAETILHVAHDSEVSMRALKQLELEAESVKGIVKTIREIASQTSLLALNAAIEAAHAGDSGRGFSIVAQEVRKLAAQAEEATHSISGRLQGIAVQAADAVQATESSQGLISESRRKMELAVETFSGINGAARELDQRSRALKELF
ncbi:methyl-accepting chemotaxis protein [Paenibacillus pinistramenti]|uniref:methyl-accepting chemotaxis protein n=1 Tax=Paenibacillus pinistramenti TaxID=1768003 RepID=UPI001EF05EDA|nr:methyl-accepting chemotaxis protein [Paenibacillus pinistramenti]